MRDHAPPSHIQLSPIKGSWPYAGVTLCHSRQMSEQVGGGDRSRACLTHLNRPGAIALGRFPFCGGAMGRLKQAPSRFVAAPVGSARLLRQRPSAPGCAASNPGGATGTARRNGRIVDRSVQGRSSQDDDMSSSEPRLGPKCICRDGPAAEWERPAEEASSAGRVISGISPAISFRGSCACAHADRDSACGSG